MMEMKYTKLKCINQYKNKSINPAKTPDTVFEMYSVPIYETGHPEYLRGNEIASNKVIVEKNDILLCKINPRINRVWVVADESDKQNIASSEWIVIRNSEYNAEFLAWYFRSFRFQKLMMSEVTGIGGSLTRAQPKCVAEYPVPVLDRKKQNEIVEILNKCKFIIDSRKRELVELDNLIKARFVEMFGDMYLNSKGWSEAKLESMADVVSGITKGRKTKSEDLTEVPYMAVSNVKDGYIDWTTVKTIGATQQEIEQYRLLADDVLMTEGGDPDKVGRGAIIKEPLENCIHQNHIFRVRLDESVVLPEFFAEYLQHQRSKRYFLGCAKQTTGIASINMTQLRALPVLIPPLSKQEEFVLFKAQVDKSKVAIQAALDKSQLLFDSLMQKYFG